MSKLPSSCIPSAPVVIPEVTETGSWIYEPPHAKTNKMNVCPAKTQISLGIRPVWSESSLRVQLVATS